MAKLGEQSGLFDVVFRTDFRLVTKQPFKDYLNGKNLNDFDAVMLFTQGDFPIDAQQKADFLSFVHDDGKGLLVAHSGTDYNKLAIHTRRQNEDPQYRGLAATDRHDWRSVH